MVVTNLVGVAFAATLLGASDEGVAFAFPEDGATNVLSWTQISPASRKAVCEAADFEPVPPELVATFNLTRRELQRLSALEADRRIDTAEADARRVRARAFLSRRCADAGLDGQQTERLLKRLGI